MNLRAPKISPPFTSSTEEEKDVLSERLNLYKDKLDDQWSGIKHDLSEYGKRAAIIGGVVLGVYGLLNLILPEADDDEELHVVEDRRPVKKAGIGVPLAGAIQSILWTVAMNWAKEKVRDFVVADKPANIESEE